MKRLFLIMLLLAAALPLAADECLSPKNPVRTKLACGKVVDPDGDVVPNIDLQLLSKEAIAGGAHTDSEGNFIFGQLPAGQYTLTTNTSGWKLAWPVEIIAGPSGKACKEPLTVKVRIGLSSCGSSVTKKGYRAKF